MLRFPDMALGELEQEVLDFLWDHGPSSPNAVHDVLGARRGTSVKTVQSALKRLFGKKLLSREKVSHAYVYAPACTKAEFRRDILDEVVHSLMEGEPDAMLAAFVDLTERAGAEHLERLQRLVAERRRDGEAS